MSSYGEHSKLEISFYSGKCTHELSLTYADVDFELYPTRSFDCNDLFRKMFGRVWNGFDVHHSINFLDMSRFFKTNGMSEGQKELSHMLAAYA